SADLKLLEEATISVCKSLGETLCHLFSVHFTRKIEKQHPSLLTLVCSCFFSSHLFIWQAHNALFIICCLLKVFISRMSEEELQLHFTYEEKA
ncbi:DYM protein, partial [Cinclus mexicanus]|nr:DYM protein [Cinclus mexicanus]